MVHQRRQASFWTYHHSSAKDLSLGSSHRRFGIKFLDLPIVRAQGKLALLLSDTSVNPASPCAGLPPVQHPLKNPAFLQHAENALTGQHTIDQLRAIGRCLETRHALLLSSTINLKHETGPVSKTQITESQEPGSLKVRPLPGRRNSMEGDN